MKELLTPKQVARAIGVSESSVKRWCDRGIITTERTAGGHRRLRVNSVLSFLRENGHQIVHPEILGLPASTGQTEWTIDRARNALRDALMAGDEQVCRQIVMDVLLSPQSVSLICDQVIAGAFVDIGDLWNCGQLEIYQERRACEISILILHELRRAVVIPQENRPTAIGASLDGDQYSLPLIMSELVLRDCGWNASSLGNGLPFSTLRTAVEQTQPKILWVCVSWIRDEATFITNMLELYDVTKNNGAAFVIGGRVLVESIRKQIKYTTHCDTMGQLEDFARTLGAAYLGSSNVDPAKQNPTAPIVG